jgi:hypothetical protein
MRVSVSASDLARQRFVRILLSLEICPKVIPSFSAMSVSETRDKIRELRASKRASL